jgi:regulatory protein
MTRIERIEPSKHKRGRVLLFLEGGALLKVTEQELLDFGLRAGDQLSDETLEKLKKAAGGSNVKATAADLIGKRAMSKSSLEKKLKEKGATDYEARYASEWLEAIGAIDDAAYAAALVRHCGDKGYVTGLRQYFSRCNVNDTFDSTAHELVCDNGQYHADYQCCHGLELSMSERVSPVLVL